MIGIVLADDHTLIRQALRGLLEAEPDLRIVGEAADGLEAVRLVERLQPNVLVVDILMPGLNGLDVTRQVRQESPSTQVVVLSMHATEAYVLEALRHGATGYVLKDSTSAELIQAVREAAAGRRYLSSPLSRRAIDAYAERARSAPSLDPYDTLTSREREVFQLVAEGHSNQETAARLSISPRTVETHRASVMRKLGLRTQSDLIRFALRRGLLPAEP
ncbi:MAG: response regulator transcription factor [Candidatus Rokubacteria bacterium]|nr:response regulator transcription factor [Candidatus Rokubacteria bacterium]